ncbi:DUF2125 domain-containing protein [Beijerinckia indica]|uniref:DUF2125 domain-containing protein n=1 Tax=Beijerinckia indica subsp. indica (strain ATCC 9039 / DSM 1715 / NCIMB 8712) TaxID=395963 RepID=B2IG42_BEII9|nr:DUF2125 domain-containing protein [Beijerinckia indica]ACB97116.1 conserved hypothetical protein [Beijerinckia indica subsp. indica ATCC 9039]
MSRWLLVLPFALVGLAGLGAWGFWSHMARETESFLDLWQEQEEAVGRHWTCPDRRLTGFPFEIIVSCAKPHFRGEINGRLFEGDLGGFRAEAALVSPNRIIAHMQPPFSGATRDKAFEVTLQWKDLTVELDSEQDVFNRSQVDIVDLDLHGQALGFGPLEARVERIETKVQALPDRPDQAYDFHVALHAAAIPALDSFLGNSEKADLGADGTVTRLRFNADGLLVDQIEAWRQAGGSITLARAWLTKGAIRAGLDGTLGLDPSHRPTGRLQARLNGLEELLRSYGVNPGLVQAGSLLSGLFGGNAKPEAQDDQATGLRLPVRISEGSLYIGPVRTPVSWPPLY